MCLEVTVHWYELPEIWQVIGIPLIGVNLGTLGYLCELERSTVYDAIDRLFEDRYELETRMLIKGSSQKDGSGKATFALNDIVIHTNRSAADC